MPMGSSGAVSATAPFPWSRERLPVPAGRARGFLPSGGSWTLAQARERAMARADHARAGLTVRCAIYTRKSSDDGLEQEFNSLDAQREACEAYIVSQRHAGWIALIAPHFACARPRRPYSIGAGSANSTTRRGRMEDYKLRSGRAEINRGMV